MSKTSLVCLQFDLDALVSVNTFSQKSFLQKGFKYIYLTKINKKNDLNEASFSTLNSDSKKGDAGLGENVHKRAVLASCCAGNAG